MSLIQIRNWPRAIAHLDADAFFASVEQSLDPSLKGRPVTTGSERGIIAALSYEAKAAGIRRAMPIHEAKKLCPDCVFLPSDYETYSIFSRRMFSIIRKFTPTVEEYSIDEAFFDLTGLRRLYRTDYEGIAKKIQDAVETQLGITVSIGISLSKQLAKLCSKLKKPHGLVAIGGRQIDSLLKITPLEKIWGFGPNTVALLEKHGIRTALDFVERPQKFAQAVLGKIGFEMWAELRGEYINKVNTLPERPQGSISKTKTFTPPSSSKDFVWAQALRNLESACIKARRHGLAAKNVSLLLKSQSFETFSDDTEMDFPSSAPSEIQRYLKKMFEELFRERVQYRATGVVISKLSEATLRQFDLFCESSKILNNEKLFLAVDEAAKKFGKHTLHFADSHAAATQHRGSRGEKTVRKTQKIRGETERKYIGLPVLSMKKNS